ncbi:MAG: winged helix-turn-helix domain-containing protein [Gammaproteobacteria bacterium]|nr:winged helix-turn-helix domain-containing protein [Gammaproteobacteria bacterium]
MTLAPETASRVLIVDADGAAADALRTALLGAGYATDVVGDLCDAVGVVRDRPPALIVVDWNAPGSSALDKLLRLREARARAPIPIVIASALRAEADIVAGLELGADDYLVKPFSMREAVARVSAVLRGRRRAVPAADRGGGELEIDRAARRIVVRGRPLRLRGAEYRLLEVLLRQSGRALSRREMRVQAWGERRAVDDRTVDVNVQRLRRTLDAAGCQSEIQTVRGFGYRLVEAGRAQ